MSFAAQLKAIADKAGTKVETVTRKVTVDMAGEIIALSPVGNPSVWQSAAPAGYVGGRFRNNWMFGQSQANTATNNGTDPTGANAMSRLSVQIQSAQIGSVWYITNSLPYARALEYGHSSQAPAGMVRLTVQRWNEYIDKAAKA